MQLCSYVGTHGKINKKADSYSLQDRKTPVAYT